jgi:hypothetical protein
MHRRLFPQRFLPDLRHLGEQKVWAINVSFRKIKAKPSAKVCLPSDYGDCGTLGFLSSTVSLPNLVQQSRALYRTSIAKVKRQKRQPPNCLCRRRPKRSFTVNVVTNTDVLTDLERVSTAGKSLEAFCSRINA